MRQKNGRYICVQILQTLSILFENIRNETSLCKYPILKNSSKEKNLFSRLSSIK